MKISDNPTENYSLEQTKKPLMKAGNDTRDNKVQVEDPLTNDILEIVNSTKELSLEYYIDDEDKYEEFLKFQELKKHEQLKAKKKPQQIYSSLLKSSDDLDLKEYSFVDETILANMKKYMEKRKKDEKAWEVLKKQKFSKFEFRRAIEVTRKSRRRFVANYANEEYDRLAEKIENLPKFEYGFEEVFEYTKFLEDLEKKYPGIINFTTQDPFNNYNIELTEKLSSGWEGIQNAYFFLILCGRLARLFAEKFEIIFPTGHPRLYSELREKFEFILSELIGKTMTIFREVWEIILSINNFKGYLNLSKMSTFMKKSFDKLVTIQHKRIYFYMKINFLIEPYLKKSISSECFSDCIIFYAEQYHHDIKNEKFKNLLDTLIEFCYKSTYEPALSISTDRFIMEVKQSSPLSKFFTEHDQQKKKFYKHKKRNEKARNSKKAGNNEKHNNNQYNDLYNKNDSKLIKMFNFVSQNGHYTNQFIIDSGANVSVVNDLKYLQHMTKGDPIKLNFADGKQALGETTLYGELNVEFDNTRINIQKVYYAPKFPVNIISKKAIRNNASMIFSGENCYVVDTTGKEYKIGYFDHNIAHYVLDVKFEREE